MAKFYGSKKPCTVLVVPFCTCLLCLLLWNFVIFWTQSSKKMTESVGVFRERYGYTRISIHNRNLNDLFELFKPYNVAQELRRKDIDVLEVGCGEGNTLLQILEANPSANATCLNAPNITYTVRGEAGRDEASYGVLLQFKGLASWLSVCKEYEINCPHNKYPKVRYGLLEDNEVNFDEKFDIIFSRGALYYLQDRTLWKYAIDKLKHALCPDGMAFLQILFHIRKSRPKEKRIEIEMITSVYVSTNSYIHLYWSPERFESGIGNHFSSINMVLVNAEDDFAGQQYGRDPLQKFSVPKSCLQDSDIRRMERMVREVGTRKKGQNVVHGIISYIKMSAPRCAKK